MDSLESAWSPAAGCAVATERSCDPLREVALVVGAAGGELGGSGAVTVGARPCFISSASDEPASTSSDLVVQVRAFSMDFCRGFCLSMPSSN